MTAQKRGLFVHAMSVFAMLVLFNVVLDATVLVVEHNVLGMGEPAAVFAVLLSYSFLLTTVMLALYEAFLA